MVTALRLRLSRLRLLFATALRLISTGQFDVLSAVFRRRFLPVRKYRIEYLPDEGPTPPRIETNFSDGSEASWSSDNARHLTQSTDPLVSVIIPCFNYGGFLERAIDSVLNQTLSAVELIVIEGGSTDKETVEIVKRLDKARIRVIMQDKPTLVGANRNAGIAISRGRYICCLDADDTLDPTYIEKAAYHLEAHQYDIVSTGIRLVGEKSGTIDILETPDLRDMTTANHVATCAVFRRSLWEKVGGFHDTGKGQDHVAEDWDFWLRCAASGARIHNITGEHLFNYTVHSSGSLSSSNVRSLSKQKASILDRNKSSLTRKAFSHSREQAHRRILRTGLTRLRQTPHSATGAKRSLLVAVPFLIVGGAERLLSSVIRHLVSQGWSVTVISTLPQQGHDDASGWFKSVCNEVYMLPMFLREWEFDSFIRYLIATRGFDAALIAGSRVFYDLLPEIKKTNPDLALVDLLFNTVGHTDAHTRYIDCIDYAIAENPEVIAWFKSKGWADAGVKLVESGVDIHNFGTTRSAVVARELNIDDNEIVVGFSGRLSDEKAPEVFLEIAQALKNDRRLRFVMTGGGPLKAKIETASRNLPEDVRFDFLGMVESTKDYFATYDIFVLPSRLDGRPIALLEALASGCAVVASDVGGVPTVLGNGGAGLLCKPANTAAFVAAIQSIVTDTDKLHRMKKVARETAGQMRSETQMGSAYEDALEAAIMLKRAKTSSSTVESAQLRADG